MFILLIMILTRSFVSEWLRVEICWLDEVPFPFQHDGFGDLVMQSLAADREAGQQEAEAEWQKRQDLGDVAEESPAEWNAISRHIHDLQATQALAGSGQPGGTFEQRPVEQMNRQFQKGGSEGLFGDDLGGNSAGDAKRQVDHGAEYADQEGIHQKRHETPEKIAIRMIRLQFQFSFPC